MEIDFFPFGDQAIVVEILGGLSVETTAGIRAIASRIERAGIHSIVEVVPAFTTVTVFYEVSAAFRYKDIRMLLGSLLADLGGTAPKCDRTVEIPVCYGGVHGPDLETVAELNQLSSEEVVQIHSEGMYEVQMIGFAPGFPYLRGMSQRIATPRRQTPRLRIPARSIGIAGIQTGVYPIESPGGWQLIGRTPTELFLPNQDIPSLLRAGDRVKFVPITSSEFSNWEADHLAKD